MTGKKEDDVWNKVSKKCEIIYPTSDIVAWRTQQLREQTFAAFANMLLPGENYIVQYNILRDDLNMPEEVSIKIEIKYRSISELEKLKGRQQ